MTPAAAPSYTLGPLSGAVDPAEFKSWIAAAHKGDRVTFAWGPVPPRATETWRASVAAVSAELITVTTARVPSEQGGCTHWIAVRLSRSGNTAGAGGADSPPSRAARATSPESAEIDAALLRALRRAANLKLACPSNAELARAISSQIGGSANADQVRYRLQRLVREGVIDVASQPSGERKIKIVIDKVSTGWSAPHRFAAANHAKAKA